MSGREDARRDAALKAGLSNTAAGVCLSIDWANKLLQVDLGGLPQSMPWAGEPPWVGDAVRVVYAGRKPVAFATYGAPIGTVQSVTSTVATVLGDDGVTYAYPFRNGDTLAASNRVLLDHAHRIVTARYTANPDGSVANRPPAPPSSSKHKATFRPTQSGNFRNGAFDSEFVEISTTRSGFYWYGKQIADTIPNTATVTKAILKLEELWDNVPGTASHLGTHAQLQRTSSPPALSGSINVSNGGSIDISSFATALKNGTAYGVGFAQNSGWRRFDTRARSGSIYMEWTT